MYDKIMKTVVTFAVVVSLLTQSTATQFPADIFVCPGTAALTTTCMSTDDYLCVSQHVIDLLDNLPDTCTGNTCPKADFAGCVLRLSGHDFMDFQESDGSGGADGCLDFDDVDNIGLQGCMSSALFRPAVDDASLSTTSLLTAYEEVCETVSLADFLVIAAESVMSHLSTSGSLDFISQFQYGRTTALSCTPPALPNPEGSCTEVTRVFMTNMGLDWTEAAALMGVHTLGRAHPDNSGYDGWWSDTENSATFNNDYYTSLIAKGWVAETSVNGNPDKNQWIRPPGVDGFDNDGEDNVGHKEMMLNTDMCLVYTDNGGEELNAADHDDCCAWVDGGGGNSILQGLDDCGNRGQCCGNNQAFRDDCDDDDDPIGPAVLAVRDFHGSENDWLDAFMPVWAKVTESGHTGLQSLEATCTASFECSTDITITSAAPTPFEDVSVSNIKGLYRLSMMIATILSLISLL